VLTVTGNNGESDDVTSADFVDKIHGDDEEYISSKDHVDDDDDYDVTESVNQQQQQPANGHQTSLTAGHQHHNKRFTVDRLLSFVSISLGTNLIHDFTAVTFSVKLTFFREKRRFP